MVSGVTKTTVENYLLLAWVHLALCEEELASISEQEQFGSEGLFNPYGF